MEENSGKISKRVAVIAVHGVGDPGVGSTAQSIATLLTRLEQANGHSVYEPFVQEGLTISNREVNADIPREGKSDLVASHATRRLLQSPLSTALDSTPRMAVSSDPISFIRSQLEGFNPMGDDRTNETVRHSGRRVTPGSEPLGVDVYEVYWADLMRIGSGVVTLFTELYQLMFHLGHLASKTVSAARAGEKAAVLHRLLWGGFETSVTLASQYLSSVVFLLNVWLFPIVLLASLLIGSISVWQCTMTGLALLVVGALTYAGFYKTGVTWLFQIGLIIFVLSAAAVIAVHGTTLASNGLPFHPSHLHGYATGFTILLFLGLASLLIWALVIAYDKSNPNSKAPALLLGLLIWGTVLFFFWEHYFDPYLPVVSNNAPFDSATWAILESLVFLTIFAKLNYAALLIIELIAVAFGVVLLLLTSKSRNGATWDRIFRVVGTVIFGLGLPTVMFSVVTITAWAAYSKLLLPKLTSGGFGPALSEKLLAMDSQGFLITVSGAGIAALLAVAVLIPSILAEFCWFGRSDGASAERLAKWLTAGGVTLIFAMGVLFLAGTLPLVWMLYRFDFVQSSNELSAPVLFSFVATLGLTVLVLKDHFGAWTLAMGPILNKILDVDSYLRQFPQGCTPKARVFCRYASLLRYVFKQDDVEKVVILAYSQGTVITADLLKFLNDENVVVEKDLFKIDHEGHRQFKKEVLLFTMGCPLRQLYSERFPTWYDWARSKNIQKRPTPPPAPNIKSDVQPLTPLLGVKSWSNAYGTGDYIGRALWRGSNDHDFSKIQDATWVTLIPLPHDSVSEKIDGTAREFCIGPFAHIQYWNEPGDSVARELDRLIHG